MFLRILVINIRNLTFIFFNFIGKIPIDMQNPFSNLLNVFGENHFGLKQAMKGYFASLYDGKDH